MVCVCEYFLFRQKKCRAQKSQNFQISIRITAWNLNCNFASHMLSSVKIIFTFFLWNISKYFFIFCKCNFLTEGDVHSTAQFINTHLGPILPMQNHSFSVVSPRYFFNPKSTSPEKNLCMISAMVKLALGANPSLYIM